jgi:GTP-binding protein HflX
MPQKYIKVEDHYEVKEVEEKAVLIDICLPKEKMEDRQESVDELGRLVETAGFTVIGKHIQRRQSPRSTTFVGSGFLQAVVDEVTNEENVTLVFNRELLPTQSRNVTDKFKMEAVDRTEIILSIFHDHAKTNEARLQVRLAELKYQLPRIKKMWDHLDRERGSVSGASGGSRGVSRGMGEKQSERDRREIRDEISKIEMSLRKIMTQKESQRQSRKQARKVCLCGYTNAGKSTLFNYLTDAHVLQEDKLFATLDSTARQLDIGIGEKMVISDTVGFIADLPHNLVASFKATLKDVMDADLLLHVVDYSDPRHEFYIEEVRKVLKQIGADHIPELLVLNKIDKLNNLSAEKEHLEQFFPRHVMVSAQEGYQVDKLLAEIEEIVCLSHTYELFIPHSQQRAMNVIYKLGRIIDTEFTETGTNVKAEFNKRDYYKIMDLIKKEEEMSS